MLAHSFQSNSKQTIKRSVDGQPGGGQSQAEQAAARAVLLHGLDMGALVLGAAWHNVEADPR
jgi:hypothetical protein